jgi:hypothetical protein
LDFWEPLLWNRFLETLDQLQGLLLLQLLGLGWTSDELIRQNAVGKHRNLLLHY